MTAVAKMFSLETGAKVACGDAVLLRAQIKTHANLRMDLIESIRGVLRQHGIAVGDELAKELTIAAVSEVDIGRAHVIV